MNRLTEDEIRMESERLKSLRDQPIDLTDSDCPPSQPGRKWHRGLPPFLLNKKADDLQTAESQYKVSVKAK
jgi:hypothetical protein